LVRLFVAVELPDEIRENIRASQEHLKKIRARLTLVDPPLIHITLKFIGEVDEPVQEKIMAALEPIQFVPFEISVKGLAGNNASRPRVIWARISDNGRCAELAGLIEKALVPLGILPENRPFRAHATVARVKQFEPDLIPAIRSQSDCEFGSAQVNGFSLKKSTLTPSGPRYEDVMVVTW
jgi:2'-5' RNA ligase